MSRAGSSGWRHSVPVERRRESAGLRQILLVTFLVAGTTEEAPQPGPIVVGKGGLRNTFELKEELVPSHLILPKRLRDTGVTNRQDDQFFDTARMRDGRAPGDGRPQSCPRSLQR